MDRRVWFVTCSYQVDIEIGYFCVPDIIAVWLEREAENQHVSLRSLELSAFRCILNLSCHPYRHLLVNLAGCREQRWYHVNLLCLVNQVVWVYRDAVAANESWSSWHEVPFVLAAAVTSSMLMFILSKSFPSR